MDPSLVDRKLLLDFEAQDVSYLDLKTGTFLPYHLQGDNFFYEEVTCHARSACSQDLHITLKNPKQHLLFVQL